MGGWEGVNAGLADSVGVESRVALEDCLPTRQAKGGQRFSFVSGDRGGGGG